MTDHEPDAQGDAGGGAASAGRAAELGTRFLARLIDGVVLWAVFAVIIVPIVVVALFSGSYGFGSVGTGVSLGSFVASVVFSAVSVGYFAFMESSRGQTVGKMAMKLKTQGPDGNNPSLEMAIRRNAWLALGIVPFIGGIAQLAAIIYIAVTISQSSSRIGWHDTFAGGTRVVETG